MSDDTRDRSRRRFLAATGAALAGGVGLASATTSAQSSDTGVTRPAEYRWDLRPARDEERRTELGEYVDDVGPLVEDHPAFAYSTEDGRDDHGVDFEALKLYRERNFAEYDEADSAPLDDFVAAFDDEDLFETAKTDEFLRESEDDPAEWDAEAWRNADSFGESLDYAHGLLLSMDYNTQGYRHGGLTAVLREAYRRHHPTYEPLAWSFTMDVGPDDHEKNPSGDDGEEIGLVYSPEDEELRTFAVDTATPLGIHDRIEEWPVTADPTVSKQNEPSERDHPLLFPTVGWNRQGLGFHKAKARAVEMINHVGCDGVGPHFDREGRVALTTGLVAQVTRTLLEYNRRNAEFDHLWNLASVMEYARDRGGNYVFDVAPESDGYGGVFDGNFAVYEVGYDYVVDLVARDAKREFDEFGDAYGLGRN